MTSQRNSSCNGVQTYPILRPLDACGQDRCAKYNQFSRSSKPALVLSTERVLCFLDVGRFGLRLKKNCRLIAAAEAGIDCPSFGDGTRQTVNRRLKESSATSIQKTRNLQHLPFRLCLRERTLTARETVLFFESAAVLELIPAAGREHSHPTSEPEKVGRTAICDRTLSHRMKRVMRRSKLFITRKLPVTQGCWVGNSRRHNKQAPQVNSQISNCNLIPAERQEHFGISPVVNSKKGVPRTALEIHQCLISSKTRD